MGASDTGAIVLDGIVGVLGSSKAEQIDIVEGIRRIRDGEVIIAGCGISSWGQP